MGQNLTQFTIGIEEEYMVLDPASKELKSHQQAIVNEGEKVFKDKIKAEMHQAVVEVGTKICTTADEAYQEIKTLRKGWSGWRAGAHARPFYS
jgi:carboxylate-amine ligase